MTPAEDASSPRVGFGRGLIQIDDAALDEYRARCEVVPVDPATTDVAQPDAKKFSEMVLDHHFEWYYSTGVRRD